MLDYDQSPLETHQTWEACAKGWRGLDDNGRSNPDSSSAQQDPLPVRLSNGILMNRKEKDWYHRQRIWAFSRQHYRPTYRTFYVFLMPTSNPKSDLTEEVDT